MVLHNPSRNRFEIDLQGQTALLDYQRRGNAIAFTHTEVPSIFEGKGFGAALVKAGLEWARAESATVIPACPFVVTYIRRHPEWADLVAPEWQARVKR